MGEFAFMWFKQPELIKAERLDWVDAEGKPMKPDWMVLREIQKEQETKALVRAAKMREERQTYVLAR